MKLNWSIQSRIALAIAVSFFITIMAVIIAVMLKEEQTVVYAVVGSLGIGLWVGIAARIIFDAVEDALYWNLWRTIKKQN